MSQYHLNLTQPDFWNKPNLEDQERWNNLCRNQSKNQNAPADFWLLDGPPYANGNLHLGHLLNKYLKDAFCRYHVEADHSVRWRAGWDCHGLPLELATQKSHPKLNKHTPEYLHACRNEAQTWSTRQSETFSKLGLVADLDHPWKTMDPKREALALNFLREMWQAELLVERNNPTHWCTACKSALAASELEKSSSQKDSLFAWTPLTKESAQRMLPDQADLQVALCYWTTTPWTLPANVAFAYAENEAYVLVEFTPEVNLLCSESSLPQLRSTLKKEMNALLRFSPSEMASLDLMAHSPVRDATVPVRPASFVSKSDGSGFVHVAPAFGPEDYEWAEAQPELQLDLTCPMSNDGKYADSNLQGFLGKNKAEARLAALALLSERTLHHETAMAESQTCWRHGVEVHYMASRQWALDLDKPFLHSEKGLRDRALGSLDAMNFLPNDQSKTSLRRMLEGRRFWTLSRDRKWGLPLPFLRDAEGRVSDQTNEWWKAAVDVVELSGVEGYHALPTPDGLFKESQCVDVWFDSGCSFLTAAENGFDSPDLVVEGLDQTRGWFLSSMLLHAFKSDKPVFKSVVTHGFVVDEHGRKLAKSKGNAPDTEKLLAENGTDALRLWALSQSLGQDVVWSKQALEASKKELRDWRNFLRFLLAHHETPTEHLAPQSPLDHLACEKLLEATRQWRSAFDLGQPQLALSSLSHFRRWASNAWFELSKRDLYCSTRYTNSVQSRRMLFGVALQEFLLMLAPFMPLSVLEAQTFRKEFHSRQQLPAFAPALARDAAKALSWRELVHKQLEAHRTELKDFKTKFVVESDFATLAASLLDCRLEHLVRGVAFAHAELERPEQWRVLSTGCECHRCRGLFLTGQLTMQTGALCSTCLLEESQVP